MIVSNSNGLSYLRENFKAKIKENGSYLDIWFNYCGEDIWIAIPKDKLIGETSVTYDFPLDAKTLLNKIKKLRYWNETNRSDGI